VIRATVIAAVALHATSAFAGRHCHEVSPVVGYRHCGSFGRRWAHRAAGSFGFDLSAVVERIGLRLVSASGASYSPTVSTMYHAAFAPGSDLHPIGEGGRLQWGYSGEMVSAKFSATLVFFGRPTVVTTQDDGQPPATSSGGDSLEVAGAFGVHRRSGDVSYGAEVALGVRTVWLPIAFPEGYTTCEGGATGRNCIGALSDVRPLVEPRVHVDYWIHRQVSLRVTGGYSLVGDGQSIAVGLAFHLSPYDGS
jgi:hypothetical protein